MKRSMFIPRPLSTRSHKAGEMHHQKESQELSVTGWRSPLQGKGRFFAAGKQYFYQRVVVVVSSYIHRTLYYIDFILIFILVTFRWFLIMEQNGKFWKPAITMLQGAVILVVIRLLQRCLPYTTGRPSAMMWLTGYVMQLLQIPCMNVCIYIHTYIMWKLHCHRDVIMIMPLIDCYR